MRSESRLLGKRLCAMGILIALMASGHCLYAQGEADGGVSFDGGGQEILESIFVPYLPNAPFSLTLAAEWSRPLTNGGSFTVVNSRPIKRDRVGRIYQERWLMAPKGSKIVSHMSWIQIADPVAHTIYQCNARLKVCDLVPLKDTVTVRFDPSRFQSGPLKDDKGMRTHEDLGKQYFAGVPVHEYRDTMTLNAGVLGNDMPMSTVRRYCFSAELGLNLSSILEAPQIGRQTFTVTEITTADPDPSYFRPPLGYKLVDHLGSVDSAWSPRRKRTAPPPTIKINSTRSKQGNPIRFTPQSLTHLTSEAG
jgi:hypothetical protein